MKKSVINTMIQYLYNLSKCFYTDLSPLCSQQEDTFRAGSLFIVSDLYVKTH